MGQAGPVRLFGILAVAAAYAVTGQVGLQLAVPPGYATILWPPSGIALAAVLLWGPGLWPGVALGSFLVNVWIGWNAASTAVALDSLIIPAVIGGAAALQAVVGRGLVCRFGRYPNRLTDPSHIGGLYLFGGVIACLIGCSIGVTTLFVMGRTAAANVAYNWATWWVGDMIGVFIFTPIIIIARQAGQRRRTLLTAVAALAVLSITAGVVAYTLDLERRALVVEVDRIGEELAVELDKSVRSQLNTVVALEAFYASDNDVRPDEFQRFASRIQSGAKSFAALEWIPRVPRGQRREFETLMQEQGLALFSIRESEAPEGHADDQGRDYFPVTYVEPANGNQQAIGVDLGSDPSRWAMLERSRDTGLMAVTAPITLVQDGRRAVLAAIPVFRDDQPHETPNQRRIALKGFTLAVIRLEEIVRPAVGSSDTEDVRYWLCDETDPLRPEVLSANADGPPVPLLLVGRGLAHFHTNLGRQVPLDIGGRKWVVHIAPTQAFVARHFSRDAWLVLLGGLCLSSLVGGLILIVTGREQSLLALVEERTCALRRSEERYHTIFALSPQPMWIYEENTLRFLDVNQAAVDNYGYSRDEFLGMSVKDVRPPEDIPLLVETIDRNGGELRTGERRHRRKDGGIIEVQGWSRRLAGEDQAVRLALLVDISARKRAERELATQALRFQALLKTASDGIHVLDEDGNLLEASESFLRMLGYTAEQAAKLNVSDWEAHFTPSDLRAILPKLQKIPTVFETKHRRRDGSVFDVEVNARGVELDGRTFIYASSRDITGRKKAEARVARSLAEALALHNILRWSLEDVSLDQMLNRALGEVLSLPWLKQLSRGCIFVSEGAGLRMAATRNLPPDALSVCGHTVDTCLCGAAAATRDIVFTGAVAKGQAPESDPHGHYCVPINGDSTVLGVLTAYVPPGYERNEEDERFLATVADTLAGIIRRQQVEQALRYNEEVARTLMNASADAALLLDRQGVMLATNEALAARFDRPPEDLVGKSFFEFLPPSLAETRHAEVMRVIESDMPLHGQDERDGMVLDNRLYPVHGADGSVTQVAVFSRDITERQRAERVIRELLAYQRAILANTPIGIAVYSQDRRCLEANEEFARVFGCTVEAIRGQDARLLYRDDERFKEVGMRAYPVVLGGGTFSDDVPMRRRDGADVWVRLTGRLVDAQDPQLGVIWAAENITERKTMELELNRMTGELERLARTDPLTGLANRRALADAAEAEFERCKRLGTKAALLMVDIDYFKQVNDIYGHEAGDLALSSLAAVLAEAVRATDLPVRLGGEEFAVLLPGSGLSGAVEISERIRQAAMRIKVGSSSDAFGLTVSVGATEFAAGDRDWSDTLRRADQALYQAKAAGRNRVGAVAASEVTAAPSPADATS